MTNKPTLRGRFILLRPLTMADAPMTLRWRTSDRATHLNRGAETIEAQERWIAERPSSEYNFIIERIGGSEVGMISLTDVDCINKHAMPGRFLIGEAAAVRGIPAAAEAMSLLLSLAFDTLGMHRIHGTIASDNRLMLKWQRHIGLREEGRLRDHLLINGHFQDAVCLGLLVDEYRAVTTARLAALIRIAHSPQP